MKDAFAAPVPLAGHRDAAELFVLDDLTYDAAPVPEPATLLLVGVGLGAALARRKTHRA